MLIALNAARTLTRGSLCQLAAQLELWADSRGTDPDPTLAAQLGVPAEQLRRALAARRRSAELCAAEERRARRADCRILTQDDEEYPCSLRDLALPPPVLYCRGRLPAAPVIAIVGARRMSAYGREAAELFAGRLAQSGIVIASGFAVGIDTIAHEAALAATKGRTVAVLGCGVDVDYPRQNSDLRRRLATHGALISEFPMGTTPRPWHFPIRNRVIAALATGTLVVQAKLRSGSLITAHHALELGRDVYAVPGGIFDELALGTNALIADGALVARTPDDLLEGLSLAAQHELFRGREGEPTAPPLTTAATRPDGIAGRILEGLTPGSGATAEELADRLGEPIDRVLGALLELELNGWLRREPGPLYVC